MRKTVEERLDALRRENTEKLDQMRQTVDEKLQSTLDQRLGASFQIVADRLEQVYKSMGEMQTLASGVGDVKRPPSAGIPARVCGRPSLFGEISADRRERSRPTAEEWPLEAGETPS